MLPALELLSASVVSLTCTAPTLFANSHKKKLNTDYYEPMNKIPSERKAFAVQRNDVESNPAKFLSALGIDNHPSKKSMLSFNCQQKKDRRVCRSRTNFI
jgi:hypothetical protein